MVATIDELNEKDLKPVTGIKFSTMAEATKVAEELNNLIY